MSKMNTGLLTSKTAEWGTPQDFFDNLNEEFGFTLDVCADHWNNKCDRYFTKENNGLDQVWSGVCWMNPPYGREIGKWMAKAVDSWKAGATVVCLVPSRTDTAWWHDYAMQGEVRFVRRRLKFMGEGGIRFEAPFPSAVVVYRSPNVGKDLRY